MYYYTYYILYLLYASLLPQPHISSPQPQKQK